MLMMNELRRTAGQCRHYAMCKIDFLGTGVCPAGKDHHYVAYYPQGRMDLYAALHDGKLELTPALTEIADSCTLCGACDPQCHFVSGLRPLKVMQALKTRVKELREKAQPIPTPSSDPILTRLQEIVGARWATSDPAILLTYSDDPFPLAGAQLPRYVVVPGSTEEVARVVRLAHAEKIPFAIRGNGASVFGFVFSDGIVLDLNRMRELRVDPENWCAVVGPGVTSFELQQEAQRHGMRANTAEPSATVCGNIICTGIFSTWSATYGTAADGFIDAEFVSRQGEVFRLNDEGAPSAYAFRDGPTPSPGICTQATVKLHPTTKDEEGMLVPFERFEHAVAFARELNIRRIGLSIGVLGTHYLATFLSPTQHLADRMKRDLKRLFGAEYMVYVVADAHGKRAIQSLRPAVIDQRLFKTLLLGLPNLLEGDWAELLEGFEGDRPAFETLCRGELHPLIETALAASPTTAASRVPEDLRPFYEELYGRSAMTDPVWLSMFRIVSSRMGRHKHMFAFLLYLPIDRFELIERILGEFRRIGDRHGIDHDYGFLTPMDFGKRAILEYDYYLDHTSEEEKGKIRAALQELDPILTEYEKREKGVRSIKYVFSQGCTRKESFLYRDL